MAESRSALTFALWLASWLFSSCMAFLAAAAIFVSTVPCAGATDTIFAGWGV